MFSGPAYRITTERLVLRCFEPRDAAPLKIAVDESLDHLRAWTSWAAGEPQSLDEKLAQVRAWRAKFDRGEDCIYAIVERETEELVGSCALHPRADGAAREIGYWIGAKSTRRGFATEAASALVRIGFEIEGAVRVEIHCDPDNVASSRIPARLGLHCDGTLRARLPRRDGSFADRMVWSMLADEYSASPCARIALDARDAIDRVLIDASPPPPRRGSGFR